MGNPVGSDNTNGENWTKLRCILEAELTGLIDELDVKNRKEPRMTPAVRT